jgi:hypothetical protein
MRGESSRSLSAKKKKRFTGKSPFPNVWQIRPVFAKHWQKAKKSQRLHPVPKRRTPGGAPLRPRGMKGAVHFLIAL